MFLVESARIGHQLADHLDVRTLKGHAARHDKTDIARAEDNDFLAGHIAVNVDDISAQYLRRDTPARTCASDVERASRALAAAHCKNDCGSVDLDKTVLFVDCGDDVVVGNGERHRVCLYDDARCSSTSSMKRAAYSGPRKLLAEECRPKPVCMHCSRIPPRVSARSSMIIFSTPLSARLERSSHACGASADNGKIIFKH